MLQILRWTIMSHCDDCDIFLFKCIYMMLVWCKGILMILLYHAHHLLVLRRHQTPNHWWLAFWSGWSWQLCRRGRWADFSFWSPDWNQSSLHGFARPQPKNSACQCSVWFDPSVPVCGQQLGPLHLLLQVTQTSSQLVFLSVLSHSLCSTHGTA